MQYRITLAPVLILITLLYIPTFSIAQQSLTDLKSQIDANSSELDEVDKLLSDLDPNRRSAAMTALMSSGNPAFVERAVEVGLLSSDSRMRAAALKMALDTGSTLSIQVKLTDIDEEKTKIRRWIRESGSGSWDEANKMGFISFSIGKFDPKQKCWLLLSDNDCALVADGERVSLKGWRFAAGDFTLSDDGTLTGFFRANYGAEGLSVPATIRLID